MSKWPLVKLQEIVSFKTGKLDSNAAESAGKYPFFTCSPETLRINTYAFDTTAILLAGNNATGVFPVKYYSGKFNCYQRTYVIENIAPQTANLSYLYFAIQLQLKFLQSMSIGAATKFLTMRILNNLKIPLPPLPIQQKIAGILSAYDDLIENNLKRIKLLEETAQITYEEWFVRLRFPGHESTPINPETGLPEGWRQKQLADYFPIKTGKKDANIQTPDGQYPFFTCSQGTYRTDVYSFDAEAIILAGNGEFNIKYYRGKFEAYQRNYVLIPNDRNFLFLLFLFMKHYLYQITAGSKGAVIKYLTKDMIANTKFQEPTISVLTAFNDITVPVFYEIENLEKQNQRLREARDILLPRLMTGVIDVESYDPAFVMPLQNGIQNKLDTDFRRYDEAELDTSLRRDDKTELDTSLRRYDEDKTVSHLRRDDKRKAS